MANCMEFEDMACSTQTGDGSGICWTFLDDMFPGYSLMVERYAVGSDSRTETMESSINIYDLSPIPSVP